jgi:hypothetical protein
MTHNYKPYAGGNHRFSQPVSAAVHGCAFKVFQFGDQGKCSIYMGSKGL